MDLLFDLVFEIFHTFNGRAPVVRLSAKTGEGLEGLIKTITGLALDEKASASEAQWLLNVRHAHGTMSH